MYVVGNLNLNIFNCIFDGIDGTEVIITEERIKHIQERHPTDFEKYMQYMEKIIKEPDYILETNKPDTAFILKTIEDIDERFELILRLHTVRDQNNYKNSVITFLRVEHKRYQRYLRTKKILYKRG